MRDYLLTLLKLLLFWLFVFFINRAVFIIYFLPKFSGVAFSETLLSFIHGLPLDISGACYLMALPVVVLIIQQLVRYPFYKRFHTIYTILVLVISSFVSVFDLAIYSDWGVKLNYRAIHYLKYAGEG